MVAAGHPAAVDAGLAMLARGGSAADAAIATQLVLGLVEPQASGLGGGAFFLHFDAKGRRVSAIDGRETAPSGASAQLFLGADGKPMPFQAAVVGGRSVGVPGTPRLLEVMHARHGKLPWATLFEPAIALAEKGWTMSARVFTLLEKDKGLADNPAARAYFFTRRGQAQARRHGDEEPGLREDPARPGRARRGRLLHGEVAADMVAAVRGHANAGTMTLEDLAAYRVRDVEPLCGPYRAWMLCGMPPSSSGGIAVLQILGVLSGRDLSKVRPDSAEAVHLLAEAGRLAFADRNRYVGDDRFTDVPVKGLVDPAYLADRARLIADGRSMGNAKPGTPPGLKVALADDPVDEVAGTSHIAVVDAAATPCR